MTETQLVHTLLSYLRASGHFAWRVNSGGTTFKSKDGTKDYHVRFNGAAGCSDIIGVIGRGPASGRFLAVEAKIGRNKPTLHQESFLAEVRKRGGVAVLAYSLDDLIQALEAA